MAITSASSSISEFDAAGVSRGVATMLRIQRASNGKDVFMLSGRIEAEDVVEFWHVRCLPLSARKRQC